MRVIRLVAVLTVSTAILASTGDRLLPPHAFDPRAAAAGPGAQGLADSLPKFALFGWVSPPSAFEDSSRFAEMAGAGFNLVLPAFDDTGAYLDGASQLDLAAANGMRCLMWDERLSGLLDPNVNADSVLDLVATDHRDHPALAGYFLGDEPPTVRFPLLSRVAAGLRARDPGHPAWNNLRGLQLFADPAGLEAYTRAYADTVHPAVLCNDYYEFRDSGNVGDFFVNVTHLKAVARDYGLPFWSIVLLIDHLGYRPLSDGEVRWQVSNLLAYGARGIGYFTYWSPKPDPYWRWGDAAITWDGRRTHLYDLLAAFNPRVRAAGETLADLAWITTQHAGGAPRGGQAFVPDDWVSAVVGRAAIGQFADPAGRRFVLVTNSDSATTRTIALDLPEADSVERLGGAVDVWTALPAGATAGGDLHVEVALDPGDFVLLRVNGAPGAGADSGTNPGLDLVPNPARAECRFTISAAVGGATLEIIDAGGRRVWARALPPGRSTVQWDGALDRGGAAPGGLYFARVRDDRGSAVRRLVWLGRP